MTEICNLDILPTKEELKELWEGIELPSLPTFPKPFFGKFNSPEKWIEHWVQEAVQNIHLAIVSAITEAIKPVLDILDELAAIKIPNWPDISFGDFISGNVEKIVNAIKSKLDSLLPIFGNIRIPDIEVWHILQNMFTTFLDAVLDKLTVLIQPIIDLVNAKPFNLGISLPEFPKIPTREEIRVMLKRELEKFSWPGFPDIKLPKLPKFNIPEVDIEKMITGIITEMFSSLLRIWIDFIQIITDTLNLLFLKPKLCINNGVAYIKFV